MNNTIEKEHTSETQAESQLESILELIEQLNEAEESGDDERIEEIQETINEDPLDVSLRSDWENISVFHSGETVDPAEYRILLCTGGPAVQIRGEIDHHGDPVTARIEHQDWFKPWQALPICGEDQEKVLQYVSHFIFAY